MKQIDESKTVGELAAMNPLLGRVFEKAGIDFCCGGKRRLSEVCAAKGLSVEGLTQLLAQEKDLHTSAQPERNWAEASLTELCDHIVETHHAYLRQELPRLTALAEKVAAAHGARHPELLQAKSVYADLRAELEPHMMKEEDILFPACREIEQKSGQRRFPPGFIADPIHVMESEHQNAGQAMEKLSSLTAKYSIPADACQSYTSLLKGLAALESDLHQHIHKENNILFPRALGMDR